jgi:NAD(P)-dependent dehydrogenase (short-subunit alcohol dehydrogenase family)
MSDRGSVVITGASTGIGAACALALDRAGFRVFAGVRRAPDGERLRGRASGRLSPVIVDVTDEASIDAAARTVGAAVGEAGLAGLVNNAGIAVAGPLEYLPLADLRHQLDVNVVGQIAVTQAFLPLLRRARGRIVNIGSISGRLATPFLGPYAASKFALEALSDALRGELRPWGLHVSLIEPGSIATPIWSKGEASGQARLLEAPAQAREKYGAAIEALLEASRRTAERGLPPDRVAAVVLHALTARVPKTRYLVGADARVQALVRLLPDRLRDRLIARALGVRS